MNDIDIHDKVLKSFEEYVEKIHCKICKKDITKSNFIKHCKTRKHLTLSGQSVPEKKKLPFIVECECGSSIQRTSLTHHKKSVKHNYYLLQKNMSSSNIN